MKLLPPLHSVLKVIVRLGLGSIDLTSGTTRHARFDHPNIKESLGYTKEMVTLPVQNRLPEHKSWLLQQG